MATVAAIAKRSGVNPDEGKSKYGSVKFADEKNHKYPIDTEEHARAALSYFSMPKNRAKYSSGDAATIMGKIRAACKRFGITMASQISYSCSNAVALNGECPAQIMYMPAGSATIRPSVNGEAREITVTVSQRTADVMQFELDRLLGKNVEPFIDFNHKGDESAAEPKRFTWKDGEGVMLDLEWTSAGKSAVSGRNYRYFSPTFNLDENGEPGGLPTAGAIGALTNNPAFRQIKRISASSDATTGDGTDNDKGDNQMTEEEASALRTELETVRAENQTLREAADKKVSDNELEVLKAENKALREAAETQRVEAVNREADLLINGAIAAFKIAPKNETVKAGLKKWFLAEPESAKAHIESMQPNPAFKTVVTVTGAHKDIGKATAVHDTSVIGSDSGKLCRAKVLEIQAQNNGMSFQDAWQICEARFPELFAGAN
jgi:hypothetical protein